MVGCGLRSQTLRLKLVVLGMSAMAKKSGALAKRITDPSFACTT